jgi:hypothetical protein
MTKLFNAVSHNPPKRLRKFGDVTGPGSKLGSNATWRGSGVSRPTHHLAGLATKQDGSDPVSTLHYNPGTLPNQF